MPRLKNNSPNKTRPQPPSVQNAHFDIIRKLLKSRVWDPSIHDEVENALWTLVRRHYRDSIERLDLTERPDKLAIQLASSFHHERWNKHNSGWRVWLPFCMRCDPRLDQDYPPLSLNRVPNLDLSTKAGQQRLHEAWVDEIRDLLADLDYLPKINQHMKEAGQELRTILDWLGPRLAQRLSSSRQLLSELERQPIPLDQPEAAAKTALSPTNSAQIDLRDYTPASALVGTEGFPTYKRLIAALEAIPDIRTHKPQKQRLFIHAGDWQKMLSERKRMVSDSIAVDPKVAAAFSSQTQQKIKAGWNPTTEAKRRRTRKLKLGK